jgi:hypothetical protein
VYFTIGAIYLVLSLIAAWAVARVERFLRPLERAYTGRQRVDKDIVPVEEEVLARGAIRTGRRSAAPPSPARATFR